MASEPKTRPSDASVADFIAAVDNPVRRADAEVVCRMLEEVTGKPPVMWGPSIIGFGTYTGATGEWLMTGFSPRKAQTVLYVMGFEGQDALLARLGKHKTGQSCLYINKLADVDLDVLRQIAEASVADTRARFPTR
jgi:hypothetical protein